METESSSDVQASVALDPDAFTVAYLMAHQAECPACGYNVHALPAPRCPECGRPLRVMVTVPGSGISVAWVVCMIVASLASGVGLLVAMAILSDGFPREWHFALVMVYYLLCLPGPLLLLFFRRLFLRLGLFQWLIAIPLALLNLLMLVWFMVEVIII
jgi:hypothetical protein